jgi:hypothetical protein
MCKTVLHHFNGFDWGDGWDAVLRSVHCSLRASLRYGSDPGKPLWAARKG